MITRAPGASTFGCSEVNFTGVLTSSLASGHSLEIKPSAESGSADPNEQELLEC